MTTEIPYGYCHCGCGEKTNIVPRNIAWRNLKKGEPYKYLKGHGKKGITQQVCKRGHERTPENINKFGACKICAKEGYDKWSSSEKGVELRKSYDKRNPEKRKHYNAKMVVNLTNAYIANTHFKMLVSQIPPALLEAKREHIKLNRKLKEIKNGING